MRATGIQKPRGPIRAPLAIGAADKIVSKTVAYSIPASAAKLMTTRDATDLTLVRTTSLRAPRLAWPYGASRRREFVRGDPQSRRDRRVPRATRTDQATKRISEHNRLRGRRPHLPLECKPQTSAKRFTCAASKGGLIARHTIGGSRRAHLRRAGVQPPSSLTNASSVPRGAQLTPRPRRGLRLRREFDAPSHVQLSVRALDDRVCRPIVVGRAYLGCLHHNTDEVVVLRAGDEVPHPAH